MIFEQMWTTWSSAGTVVLSSVVVLVGVIAIIRVVGLRSFSKMSSFDFAVTVAIGSIVASSAAGSTPVANGILAVVVLLGCQAAIARLRRRASFSQVVDNEPLLLVRDGEFLDAALSSSRVTRSDVIAKLRETNVAHLADVRAVVLETTGDISVLHGSDSLDDILLADVRTD